MAMLLALHSDSIRVQMESIYLFLTVRSLTFTYLFQVLGSAVVKIKLDVTKRNLYCPLLKK